MRFVIGALQWNARVESRPEMEAHRPCNHAPLARRFSRQDQKASMNPYTPLLSNAVKAASLNTRATREFVYLHARKTFLAHLCSADHASTPAQIQIEMQRFDDAIITVEAAM